MAETEVALQLADRFFWAATAETVVVLDVCGAAQGGLDVGDDRMEAPAVEVVEAQLLAGARALAAYDQAQVPPGEAEVALGDLG